MQRLLIYGQMRLFGQSWLIQVGCKFELDEIFEELCTCFIYREEALLKSTFVVVVFLVHFAKVTRIDKKKQELPRITKNYHGIAKELL